MQLGIQALVVGNDVQHAAVVSLISENVHGHFGIKGPVVLVELLGAALFVDTGHMGTGEGVLTAGGNDHIGPGGGGIHYGGGLIRRIFLIVIGHKRPVALIDVIEDKGGGHGTGHVHIVQNEGNHRPGVIPGLFPQIDGDLPGGKAAA